MCPPARHVLTNDVDPLDARVRVPVSHLVSTARSSAHRLLCTYRALLHLLSPYLLSPWTCSSIVVLVGPPTVLLYHKYNNVPPNYDYGTRPIVPNE